MRWKPAIKPLVCALRYRFRFPSLRISSVYSFIFVTCLSFHEFCSSISSVLPLQAKLVFNEQEEPQNKWTNQRIHRKTRVKENAEIGPCPPSKAWDSAILFHLQ